MLPYGNKTGAIAFAFAFLGYQFLIHKITISGQITPITATLVFIPFVIAAGWAIALELGLRPALLITTTMTMLGLAWVNIFGLPPAIIFGLPHLVTNLFLMWFFARTLKDGREPLITSIARRVHGSLTPDIEIYTRRITFVWSLFFVLQVVVSLGLYIFASLEAWSMFINILNAPLIILMFLCEYSYRILRYRDHQSSIFSGLQFFSRDKPTSKSTKAR
jgi:uncharacterized membrane protein